MSQWLKKIEAEAKSDLGTVLRWFGSDHVATTARVLHEVESVASTMAGLLPDGAELQAGLAYLRTAQDKFLAAAAAAYAAVDNKSGVTVVTETPDAPEPVTDPVAAPAVPVQSMPPFNAAVDVPAYTPGAASAPVEVDQDDANDTEVPDSPAGTAEAATEPVDPATALAETVAASDPMPGRDHPITGPVDPAPITG